MRARHVVVGILKSPTANDERLQAVGLDGELLAGNHRAAVGSFLDKLSAIFVQCFQLFYPSRSLQRSVIVDTLVWETSVVPPTAMFREAVMRATVRCSISTRSLFRESIDEAQYTLVSQVNKAKSKSKFKALKDFADETCFAEYLKETLQPGMEVKMVHPGGYESVQFGDIGKFKQYNDGHPPCQFDWEQMSGTYWVPWSSVEINETNAVLQVESMDPAVDCQTQELPTTSTFITASLSYFADSESSELLADDSDRPSADELDVLLAGVVTQLVVACAKASGDPTAVCVQEDASIPARAASACDSCHDGLLPATLLCRILSESLEKGKGEEHHRVGLILRCALIVFAHTKDILESFVERSSAARLSGNEPALVNTLRQNLLMTYVIPIYVSRLESYIETNIVGSNLLRSLPTCLQELLETISSAASEFEDDSEPLQAQNNLVVAESKHPYEIASRDRSVIHFPAEVKWCVVEFDPRSCTAQCEDRLILSVYKGSETNSIRIGEFSQQEGWPSQAMLVPGNGVVLEMNTSSNYIEGDDPSDLSKHYGFKCVVMGYHCVPNQSCLQSLECEFAHLFGVCAAKLLTVPPPENTNNDEEYSVPQDNASLSRLTFASNPIGSNVCLNSDKSVATREKSYNSGCVVSSGPIASVGGTRSFTLKLTRHGESNWAGSICIGVCTADLVKPSDGSAEQLASTAALCASGGRMTGKPNLWYVNASTIYAGKRKVRDDYYNFETLRKTDVVKVVVSSSGQLSFVVRTGSAGDGDDDDDDTEEIKCSTACGGLPINEDLYVFVDIYGKSVAVKLIDGFEASQATPLQVSSSHVSKPHDSPSASIVTDALFQNGFCADSLVATTASHVEPQPAWIARHAESMCFLNDFIDVPCTDQASSYKPTEFRSPGSLFACWLQKPCWVEPSMCTSDCATMQFRTGLSSLFRVLLYDAAGEAICDEGVSVTVQVDELDAVQSHEAASTAVSVAATTRKVITKIEQPERRGCAPQSHVQTIAWVPDVAGDYSINIQVYGRLIRGSPFKVTVLSGAESALTVVACAAVAFSKSSSLAPTVQDQCDTPCTTTKLEVSSEGTEDAGIDTNDPVCEEILAASAAVSETQHTATLSLDASERVADNAASNAKSTSAPKNSDAGEINIPECPVIPTRSSVWSPDEAHTVRAAFAAMLWHEGIVHDAINYSVYLVDAVAQPFENKSEENTPVSNGTEHASAKQQAPLLHCSEQGAHSDQFVDVMPEITEVGEQLVAVWERFVASFQLLLKPAKSSAMNAASQLETADNAEPVLLDEVRCSKNHKMERCAYSVGAYRAGWNCDICSNLGNAVEKERFFCLMCSADYCSECAKKYQVRTPSSVTRVQLLEKKRQISVRDGSSFQHPIVHEIDYAMLEDNQLEFMHPSASETASGVGEDPIWKQLSNWTLLQIFKDRVYFDLSSGPPLFGQRGGEKFPDSGLWVCITELDVKPTHDDDASRASPISYDSLKDKALFLLEIAPACEAQLGVSSHANSEGVANVPASSLHASLGCERDARSASSASNDSHADILDTETIPRLGVLSVPPSADPARPLSALRVLAMGRRTEEPGYLILRFLKQNASVATVQNSLECVSHGIDTMSDGFKYFASLLEIVTSETAMSDLLWSLATTMTSGQSKQITDLGTHFAVGSSPLHKASYGSSGALLQHRFHEVMRIILTLIKSLPVESVALQLAVRCWAIDFHCDDYQLIHSTNAVAAMSKVVNRYDTHQQCAVVDAQLAGLEPHFPATVGKMDDVTADFVIKVSSREAMIAPLTDGSTETFWESGDEDKHNKTKWIAFELADAAAQSNVMRPIHVCMHVDNTRDNGHSVSKVGLKMASKQSQFPANAAVTMDVPKDTAGWLTLITPPVWSSQASHLRIEFNGRPKIRVRLCRIYVAAPPIAAEPAATALHGARKLESLHVFKRLNAHIFQNVITSEASVDKSGDKVLSSGGPANSAANVNGEAVSDGPGQVVVGSSNTNQKIITLPSAGLVVHPEPTNTQHSSWNDQFDVSVAGNILTVRRVDNTHGGWGQQLVLRYNTKATAPKTENTVVATIALPAKEDTDKIFNALQATTASHLVEELHLAAQALQSSNSHTGASRNNDEYRFQLLSTISSLVSANKVTETGIALVADLLLLLHLDTVRNQHQVLWVLGKILPPMDPDQVDVSRLPVLMNSPDIEPGIVSCLLVILSSAVSLQFRSKGISRQSTTVSVLDACAGLFPAKPDVPVSKDVAEVIILLLDTLAQQGAWSDHVSTRLHGYTQYLRTYTKRETGPSAAVGDAKFWRAVIALVAATPQLAEQVNSVGDFQQVLCTNHDDGYTEAGFHCSTCDESLCNDCDRILHLSCKTRSHTREAIDNENCGIFLEIQESSTRVRLKQFVASADRNLMKAVVEFKYVAKGAVCRFCTAELGDRGPLKNLASCGLVGVCDDCTSIAKFTCTKVLGCGHVCNGVRGERKHLFLVKPNAVLLHWC